VCANLCRIHDLQKLPPPKSKKAPEKSFAVPAMAGLDLCDVLRQKNLETIQGQIKTLEDKAKNAANGTQPNNFESMLTANETAVLMALRIEEKKLKLVEMQQSLRAQVLERSCPPATRHSNVDLHKLDMPPVRGEIGGKSVAAFFILVIPSLNCCADFV